jgi:hypothetical protein
VIPESLIAKIRRAASGSVTDGFTEAAIAAQFGVSIATIHNDLVDFSPIEKSKQAKTETNPKGSGRRKGSKTKSKSIERKRRLDSAARHSAEHRAPPSVSCC